MLMRRLLSKTATCLLLCLCFIMQLAYAESAKMESEARLFHEGWELWEIAWSTDGLMTRYDLTCPEMNVSAERLQDYLLYIMAYCREKSPAASSVTIRFPYREFDYSAVLTQTASAISMKNGIRAVGCSFLNLSTLMLKTDQTTVQEVVVELQVNNPASNSIYSKTVPYGAALEAAKALAEEIASQTQDTYGQLVLLNQYLTEQVRYGTVAEESRANSTVGALIDKISICAGFSNTVSDICFLLDIPCYQLMTTNGEHIWNVVSIDGQWRMLDCTFNNNSQSTDYFLLEDFSSAYHDYSYAQRAAKEGYLERMNHARRAASQLSARGLIQEVGGGAYGLADALTYEQLAVVLTRLDGAEMWAQMNARRFAEAGRGSGCMEWAELAVGYCVESGYLNRSLDLSHGNQVPREELYRILLRYAGVDPNGMQLSELEDTMQTRELLSKETLKTGTTMLRGEFFQMLSRLIA